MYNMYLRSSLLVFLLFSYFLATSQVIETAGSGNWSSASTWLSGVVPGASDDVRINNGHIVVVDMNPAGQILSLCKNLTIEMNAEMRLGYDGADLSKQFAINGNLHCDGTLSAGRNVPADISSGQGLIYDHNSSFILNLSSATTSISGKGYIHPKHLMIQNQSSAKQLIIDHYNVITDEDFLIKGTSKVSVDIAKYTYMSIGGTMALAGKTYASSPTNFSADMTIRGVIYTKNVNLFTKNPTDGSAITLDQDGVITTNSINGGVTATSSAGGFQLELKTNSIFRTGEGTPSPVILASGDVNFSVVNNGVIKTHYAGSLSTGAQVLEQINSFDKLNPEETAPMKDKIGATHIAGWYNFTDKPFLEEGISRFKEWGSRNIKTTISADNGKMFESYPFNHNWPSYNTPADVLKEPQVSALFSDPYFTTHAFWAPSKGVNGYYKKGADRNHNRFLDTEEQIYQAARELLSTHGHLNKKFIFQNWEGDWMLRGNNKNWEGNAENIPDDVIWQIEGMARMWRAHMRGIERAISEFPNAVAEIQYAVEFNKLFYSINGSRKTMMEINVPCVIADVVPRVRMDLSSWSAYDGNFEDQNNPYPTGFWNGIEIADYYTNDTKNKEGVSVQIGEIGMNENPKFSNLSQSDITDRYDKIVAMVAKQGVQNVYLWNFYCSGQQSVPLEKGVQYDTNYLYDVLDGKWIIEPDNSFGIAGGHLRDNYFIGLNNTPIVNGDLEDIFLDEGFNTHTIDVANLFSGNQLSLSVSSSDEAIIGVSLTNNSLVINEKTIGKSLVTIVANDGNGGVADISFMVTVLAVTFPDVYIGDVQYSSITLALEAAQAGDIIDIRGIHTESISINKSVTLRGSNPLTDRIHAATPPEVAQNRVIEISRSNGSTQALNVTIENLGIRYGNSAENGGGINADKLDGLLTLRNLIISNNSTARNGGGLSIAGSNADIINCTIQDNTALLDGGGVLLAPNNAVTIDSDIKVINSLIDSNVGRNGGGLYVNGNKDFGNNHFIDVYVENTTISNNTAISSSDAAGGGGIWSKSAFWTGDNTSANVTLQMVHATMYNNTHTSTLKNGIQFTGTPIEALTNFSMYNSIVVSADDILEKAINFTNANTTALMNNMMGGINGADAALLEAPENNNQNDKTAASSGLATSLSDEGGSVQVLAILANSQAIDFCTAPTNINLPTVDATGTTRDNLADAGAYEFNAFKVANPINDLVLNPGFNQTVIDFSDTFADPDAFVYSISVDDENVISAFIEGKNIVINEVGIGIASLTLTAENQDGSIADVFSVEVAPLLSTSSSKIKLVLYPNPIKDHFRLDIGESSGWVTIRTMHGQIVFSENYSPNKTYHVDQLSKGLYLLDVSLDDGRISRAKIILE